MSADDFGFSEGFLQGKNGAGDILQRRTFVNPDSAEIDDDIDFDIDLEEDEDDNPEARMLRETQGYLQESIMNAYGVLTQEGVQDAKALCTLQELAQNIEAGRIVRDKAFRQVGLSQLVDFMMRTSCNSECALPLIQIINDLTDENPELQNMLGLSEGIAPIALFIQSSSSDVLMQVAVFYSQLYTTTPALFFTCGGCSNLVRLLARACDVFAASPKQSSELPCAVLREILLTLEGDRGRSFFNVARSYLRNELFKTLGKAAYTFKDNATNAVEEPAAALVWKVALMMASTDAVVKSAMCSSDFIRCMIDSARNGSWDVRVSIVKAIKEVSCEQKNIESLTREGTIDFLVEQLRATDTEDVVATTASSSSSSSPSSPTKQGAASSSTSAIAAAASSSSSTAEMMKLGLGKKDGTLNAGGSGAGGSSGPKIPDARDAQRKNMKHHLLIALSNIVKLNHKRQSKLLKLGIVPILCRYHKDLSFLNDVVIPLLCDLFKAARKYDAFEESKAYVTFFELLNNNPIYASRAIECLALWIKNSYKTMKPRISKNVPIIAKAFTEAVVEWPAFLQPLTAIAEQSQTISTKFWKSDTLMLSILARIKRATPEQIRHIVAFLETVYKYASKDSGKEDLAVKYKVVDVLNEARELNKDKVLVDTQLKKLIGTFESSL